MTDDDAAFRPLMSKVYPSIEVPDPTNYSTLPIRYLRRRRQLELLALGSTAVREGLEEACDWGLVMMEQDVNGIKRNDGLFE